MYKDIINMTEEQHNMVKARFTDLIKEPLPGDLILRSEMIVASLFSKMFSLVLEYCGLVGLTED